MHTYTQNKARYKYKYLCTQLPNEELGVSYITEYFHKLYPIFSPHLISEVQILQILTFFFAFIGFYHLCVFLQTIHCIILCVSYLEK